jgi:hypothetical protein
MFTRIPQIFSIPYLGVKKAPDPGSATLGRLPIEISICKTVLTENDTRYLQFRPLNEACLKVNYSKLVI